MKEWILKELSLSFSLNLLAYRLIDSRHRLEYIMQTMERNEEGIPLDLML